MAKEFLNGSDVVPVLEHVGGKGVPKCVAGGRLGQTRLADGFLDRPLQDRFVEVVPAALAGLSIDVDLPGQEDPLPSRYPAAEVTETSSGQVEP